MGWTYYYQHRSLQLIKLNVSCQKKHINTLYYSLMCPYLTYGILLWGASCHVHLSKLIIIGAYNRAHTIPIFKHLHFLKLVLSFLKDLLPASLKHIFTLSQNQHGHNTRHSTAYKLMVQKNTHLGCVSKHHPNGSSNIEPFITWYLHVHLITHILCEFLIHIQTIHPGGLWWLI